MKINIDSIDHQSMLGWFINPKGADNKLLLFLDGEYAAITIADKERQDVAEVHGQLYCGFCFDLHKYPPFKHLSLKNSQGDMLLDAEVSFDAEEIQHNTVASSPYSLTKHQMLKQIKIDLSQRIEGDNWYAIEPTGRWGGPGLESRLTIPALEPGKYRLKLTVESEYCGLADMQVLFNEQLVRFNNSDYHAPVVLEGDVIVEQRLACWALVFKYPRTAPPDGEHGADQRKLGIFLTAVNLVSI